MLGWEDDCGCFNCISVNPEDVYESNSMVEDYISLSLEAQAKVEMGVLKQITRTVEETEAVMRVLRRDNEIIIVSEELVCSYAVGVWHPGVVFPSIEIFEFEEVKDPAECIALFKEGMAAIRAMTPTISLNEALEQAFPEGSNERKKLVEIITPILEDEYKRFYDIK